MTYPDNQAAQQQIDSVSNWQYVRCCNAPAQVLGCHLNYLQSSTLIARLNNFGQCIAKHLKTTSYMFAVDPLEAYFTVVNWCSAVIGPFLHMN